MLFYFHHIISQYGQSKINHRTKMVRMRIRAFYSYPRIYMPLIKPNTAGNHSANQDSPTKSFFRIIFAQNPPTCEKGNTKLSIVK